MKNIKSQRGSITLLVVITILFFIIITVSVYVSNSNTKVSQMQEIARIKEVYEEDVENIDEIYEDVSGGGDWNGEYVDGVPIPKGFYYVGGKPDTGLVISDQPDDENDGVNAGQVEDITVPLKGNQFVWIPVKVEDTDTETDIKAFKRTKTFEGTITNPGTSYTEPFSGITVTDETGEKAEYTEMYKSVYKYHGFYVGRYEAGCATPRSYSNKTIEQEVLVQKDKYVYDYVPWGASMTSTVPADRITGAVELSRKVYPKEDEIHGAISHLMYGVQWDAVMTYVNDASHPVTEDSSSWGNYTDYTGGGTYEKSQLQKTGANEKWKVKNMYDLAGNAYEWTMEAYNTKYRVVRGGDCMHSGSYRPASYRYYSEPAINRDYDYRSFRLVLYVEEVKEEQ